MGPRLSRCALLAPLLALLLGGLNAAPVAGADGMALIRLVHASPDAPALDVSVDGRQVATALRFADATSYAAVPAGSRAVQIFSASAGQGGRALYSASVELRAGLAYTLVAADRLAQLGAVLLTDELSNNPADQAYLRLVHGSPDAPPVADVAVVGGPVALRGLAFKSASPYLPLNPGTYAFEIRPAGTTQTLATTDPVALEAGRIYTIFVIGQFSDNTFRALLLPDNARSGGVGGPPATGAGGAGRATSLTLAQVAAALALVGLGGGALRFRRATTQAAR
jgi:hypothetical protein